MNYTFRTICKVEELPSRISRHERLFMIGSCFASVIAEKLQGYYYQVMANPYGVVFNPITLTNLLMMNVVDEKLIGERNGIYFHWWMNAQPHSHPNRDQLIQQIQLVKEESQYYLKQADWLIVTLGTAFVYKLKTEGTIVGSCHKMPAQLFDKKLLEVSEITDALLQLITSMRTLNSNLKIIFTVSPVRHLKDGFVENNLSKATLLLATHHVIHQHSDIFYFPAYELLLDDLRDYRYYSTDMVHPGELAIDYIWQHFQQACLNPTDAASNRLISEYHNLLNHRVQHKYGAEYEHFKNKLDQLKKEVEKLIPGK